ncbi:MAG: lycopene cyclase domain-containing protein [Bacteroidales bacterium]|nr:lycopene cyclase domain-containing protein [Bacteroidales bacterium]
MPLYLTLEFSSIIIPAVLSFDKKVEFYKNWPVLFPSLIITGTFFIIIDIIFTMGEIWGFNPGYHSGIMLVYMPLEEWLFFIVIPYASIFIHYVLSAYFPELILPDKITRIISVVIMIVSLVTVITSFQRTYTAVFFLIILIILFLMMFDKSRLLNRFFLTFPVILIPFIIVNGILTGSFIADEVVWYNNEEITGIRIFTIPVEDFVYCFSLILLNLLLMNYFRKVFTKKYDS